MRVTAPFGTVNVSQSFIAFVRTNGSATQALAPPVSFKQRIDGCATSATPKRWPARCVPPSQQKGHKITNSESLELIAHAFGMADWNTLSASIREETVVLATTRPTPPEPSTTQSGPAFLAHPIKPSVTPA
jgi:hypothetical protein